MKLALSLVLLFAVSAQAGVIRTPGPTPVPTATPTPAWHTLSGFPEASFKGVEPREVTGLLTEQLAAQGFEPLTEIVGHGEVNAAEEVIPSDDYHSAFIKKDVRFGIQWVAIFDYLTLPKRIKVIARPDIISLGILIPARPDDQLTEVCNTVLKSAQTELESDK